MGKHKHRTLRKRKINRKKYSTLKHRPLKYKKHYRGGSPLLGSPQSSRTSSPSNYSFKGMYSRLKNSLGITPHSISLNKIVKSVLKDIPKENQDQFITTLKSNLTKWIKDLGNDSLNQSHTNLNFTNLSRPYKDSTNRDPTNLDNTNLDNTNRDPTNRDPTNPDHINPDHINPDHTNLDHTSTNSQTDILPEQIISNSQI